MIYHLNKIRSWFSVIGFPYHNQSFLHLRKSPLYIDKSELIELIIHKGQFAPLITRPRRWGKTLTLDMLQLFFQPNGWRKAFDKNFNIGDGNEYLPLFVGNEQYGPLKIAKFKDIIEQYQGQNPVVVLNFANLKFNDKQEFNLKMKNLVHNAYSQHEYIYFDILRNLIENNIHTCWKNKASQEKWEQNGWLQNFKINTDKMLADHSYNYQHVMVEVQEIFYNKENKFQFESPRDIILGSMFAGQLSDDYVNNFQMLIKTLYIYFNRKVVVLIDEFDSTTVDFIEEEIDELTQTGKVTKNQRRQYNSELKQFMLQILKYPLSDKVQNCVIFGISDVFSLLDSSLNNISYCPITSLAFFDCFAFTNNNVTYLIDQLGELMKNDYQVNIDHEKSQLKQNIDEWYNGYNITNSKMYCPFSVIEYLRQIYNNYPLIKKLPKPQPFWVYSGTNLLLLKLGELNLGESLLIQLENLIENGIIQFSNPYDIKQYPIDATTFPEDEQFLKFILINTGYITPVEGMENTFKIPNKEVLQALLPWLNLIKLQKNLTVKTNYEVNKIKLKFYKAFDKADELQYVLENDVFPLIKITHVKERTFQDLIGSFFPTLSQTVSDQEYLPAVPEYSGSNQKRVDHVFQPINKNRPIILHEYKLAKQISQVNKLLVEATWQIYGKCYLDMILKEQGLGGENRSNQIITRVMVFYQNNQQQWKVSIIQFNHTYEQAQQINSLFAETYYPLTQNKNKTNSNKQETHQSSLSNQPKNDDSQKQESPKVKFLNQNKSLSIFKLIKRYGIMSGRAIKQ